MQSDRHNAGSVDLAHALRDMAPILKRVTVTVDHQFVVSHPEVRPGRACPDHH